MKLWSLAIFLVNLLLFLQKAESAIKNVIFSKNQRDLSKLMPLMIIQCLNEKLDRLIITEEWNGEKVFTFVLNTVSVPAFLFDIKHNIFKMHKSFPHFAIADEIIARTKVYPMSSFVITISSQMTLTSLLTNLRDSIWWNNEAHFLIYNSDHANGFKLARQYLRVAWNFNILSAIYLCWNEQGQLSAYTFNPYGRVGSAFWKIISNENNDKDYWTLLKYSFENSTNSDDLSVHCNDLTLDRTANLNNLNVRIGSNKMDEVILHNHKIEVYNDKKIIELLLNELNATYTYKHFSEFGLVTSKGPTSYLKEIQSGLMDVVTVCSVMHFDWKIQTYPHEYQEIRIVTPKEVVAIFRVFFNSTIAILPITTCLLSIVFFTLALNKSISWSFLEFLRMYTNTSILTIVQQPFHRFVLINLLFLIFVTHIYMQCFISAISTVPKYKPMIDSVEDLLNSNLLLCAAVYHEEYIYPEELFKRYISGDPLKCVKEASSSRKIACAVHHVDLAFENTDHVHIAKFSMAVGPSTYTVAPDWPLLAKFNQLLHFAAESGIYQQISVHSSALKHSKETYKNDEYSASTFSEVSLCFYTFLGGCGVAFCALLTELVVN